MTEVWKVVMKTNRGLMSVIVWGTKWSQTYEEGKATVFPKGMPGLAFRFKRQAMQFKRGINEQMSQVWKAEADVLDQIIQSLLYASIVSTMEPEENKAVVEFWKSGHWRHPSSGLAFTFSAPPGTVACTSIKLLERVQ